ncbi:hypothetical protein [Nocardia sp. NPDC050406]|uniref:hypothetical protein n=1 Tax=Nocardia sp. NPDC050406 TaxID=3364318 RepID=UPI0037A2E215
MKIKSVLVGAALAAGVVAGSGVASAYDQVYVGNYGTLAGCQAEGSNIAAHPDWTEYRCDEIGPESFDLWLVAP